MKLLSLIFLLSLATFSFGQNSKELIGETEHYKFYSNFWFNMHHFFQHEALNVEVLKKPTISKKNWEKLSASDREKLIRVVAYYRVYLIKEDLRTSDYMSDFRVWIITKDEEKFSKIPDKFKEHISQLQTVKKLYKDVFWKEHYSSNKRVLNSNLKFIKNSEKFVVKKLSNLTRQSWQKKKIRVDIVVYAKSSPRNMVNRPYTSLFPTHVVMNSSENADKPIGNWLELLYHESSHHLISSRSGFVGGTIIDFLVASKQKSLRSLWHAYLFYFSGKVTQEALKLQGIENYELYMVRNRVFSAYLPFLDKHLPDYINHKRTLKDVTASIFQDFKQSKKQ